MGFIYGYNRGMDSFIKNAHQLIGIPLTQSQVEQFETYLDLLLEWNQKINLTAIRTREEILTKHFLDSMTILPIIQNGQGNRFIDVGTGAGFPGIPLKIILPELSVTLVEATGKKAKFCQLAVDGLNLQGITVITERAESLARMPDHRERYDFVAARAVANLPTLLEYLLPLARTTGKVIAQKGTTAADEILRSGNALKVLGGVLLENRKVVVPGIGDDRFLIIVEKKSSTPVDYPRHGGIPAKKPL